MTCISPPISGAPSGVFSLSNLFGKVVAKSGIPPIRDMLVAALLVLFASAIVHADELQDWIPGVLSLPEDAEVVRDRAIGSTVRMMSITTNADVDALFDEWEESLETNGFRITRAEGEVLDNSIEFSGPGIANAKIILSPTTEDGRSLIEFDATLN